MKTPRWRLKSSPRPTSIFSRTPDVATFRQIARHTLDAGDALAGALLAGEEDFHLPEVRAKFKEHYRPLEKECTPAEMAAALRQSVDQGAAQFAAKPTEFFEHLITRMDGLEGDAARISSIY